MTIERPDNNVSPVLIDGNNAEDISVGFNNQAEVIIRGDNSGKITFKANNSGKFEVKGENSGKVSFGPNNTGPIRIGKQNHETILLKANNSGSVALGSVAAEGVVHLCENNSSAVRVCGDQNGTISAGRNNTGILVEGDGTPQSIPFSDEPIDQGDTVALTSENVSIFPRLAYRDRLQVWIARRGLSVAPSVNWKLDGVETTPTAIVDMHAAASGISGKQTFVGVFSFPASQQSKKVRAEFDDGTFAELETSPVPSSVPASGLRVLMGSCFYEPNSKANELEAAIDALEADGEVHLSCFMGDQVYLDLELLEEKVKLSDLVDGSIFGEILGRTGVLNPERSVPSAILPTAFLEKRYPNSASFSAKFAPLYEDTYFNPAFQRLALVAPAIQLADDHEYWNNYPAPQIHIGTTHSKKLRNRWAEAASELFDSYQRPHVNSEAYPVVLDVEPCSFFFADTRIRRDLTLTSGLVNLPLPTNPVSSSLLKVGGRAMTDSALAKMEAWVDETNARNRLGIFVLGQIMFKTEGLTIFDAEMVNMDDYEQILALLGKLEKPAIVLSGDIHQGRVMKLIHRTSGREIYEVVSSPIAKIDDTDGAVKRAEEFITGVLPNDVGQAFDDKVKSHYDFEVLQEVEGNQLATFNVSQLAEKLTFSVVYYVLGTTPQRIEHTLFSVSLN